METPITAKPTIKDQAGKVKAQLDTAIDLVRVLKKRHQENPAEQKELSQHVATLSSAKDYVQKIYLNPAFQTPNLEVTLSDFEDIAEDLVATLEGKKVSLRLLKGRMSGVKEVVTALKTQFPGHFLEVSNNTLERGVGVNGIVGEWDTSLKLYNKVEGNKAVDGIQINGYLRGNAKDLNGIYSAIPSFKDSPEDRDS